MSLLSRYVSCSVSEMVLNNGDVWYIIEFIFSVSCWWIASKKSVCLCSCICVWLRPVVGMWWEREVVAYRTSNDGCSLSLSPLGHSDTPLFPSSPFFHSTILSLSFIFLYMTHPCLFTGIAFSIPVLQFLTLLSISSQYALLPLLLFLFSTAPHSRPLSLPSSPSSLLSLHPSFTAIKQ